MEDTRPSCSSAVNCARGSSICSWPSRPSNPLCWAHMRALRPKPSGGHRTIGLTVSPLRVLSRLRRTLRGFGALGAGGGGGSKGAPAVGGCTAFGLGQILRARRARSPLGGGRQDKFSKATWCASYEGRRFLDADKCATFPFWAFGTILQGCSGATTAAKLMVGHPSGNSGISSPKKQEQCPPRRFRSSLQKQPGS